MLQLYKYDLLAYNEKFHRIYLSFMIITNTVLYVIIWRVFTSAAPQCSSSLPWEMVKALTDGFAEAASTELCSHFVSAQQAGLRNSDRRHGGAFFRRGKQDSWSFGPETRQCALCSKHIQTPRPKTTVPHCSPVLCLKQCNGSCLLLQPGWDSLFVHFFVVDQQ